ncbi:MAG: hypothetical protein IJ484_05075, partial [Oscillospiraceae bacterium]|nr:hypothetical protein [Oscillospiraceae bacterium]
MKDTTRVLRRPVSLLLAFALVLGLFAPCLPVAHAADPVITGITVNETVELTELVDLSTLSYWDENAQSDVQYSGYSFLSQNDLLYTVTFSDGTSQDLTREEIAARYGVGVEHTTDQHTNRWTAGNTYTEDIWLSACDATGGQEIHGTVNVYLKANPIKSIEYTVGKTLTEGMTMELGYWDEKEQKEVQYQGYMPVDCITHVKVTEADDSVLEFDDIHQMTDHYVPGGNWNWESDQSPASAWDKGPHKFTVSVLGHKTELEVEVVENPYKSFTVDIDRALFAGMTHEAEDEQNGQINTYNYYEPTEVTGAVTVTMSDGTVQNFDDVGALRDQLGVDFEAITSQAPGSEWGVGTHDVEFRMAGLSYKTQIEVKANPIKSLGFHPTYVKDGETCRFWDSTTNQEISGYDLQSLNYNINVTYTDDTTETMTLEELRAKYTDVPDYFDVWTDQAANPWQVRNTYTADVRIFGHRSTVNITVVEPVTVNSAANLQRAIELANIGGTVRLEADIVWDQSYPIVVSRNVTLDLAGHTLNFENSGLPAAVRVIGSGELWIVSDCEAGVDNGVSYGFGYIRGGTLFEVQKNAKLYLTGGRMV